MAILRLLWPAGLILNGLLAILARSQSAPFWFVFLAALCFALMLAIFYLWTQPANRVTQNWTTVPANREALRQQWECSRAANTAIAFAALCLATMSALSWRPNGS
ncbi:hypothetical protein [Candidatus Phyllobacterium onerii]|uniref:hypothetical protein n=1 Tax=Candidatus Phyllobacterium onerii TaxID=3020828 RepID=UPI00232C0F39|nr:hypothetical protein [Phyllobacterium sp. IY22]